MTDKDREIFERMAQAQEKIALIIEKQQPGKFSQILVTGATVATVMGILSAVDVVVKWIGGGIWAFK